MVYRFMVRHPLSWQNGRNVCYSIEDIRLEKGHHEAATTLLSIILDAAY